MCPDCGGRGWTVRTGACACLAQRMTALEIARAERDDMAARLAALDAEVARLRGWVERLTRREGHDVEAVSA